MSDEAPSGQVGRDGHADGPTRPLALPARSAARLADRLAARRHRKFVVGALEQAAAILGAMSASVLVVGLVGPYVAAFSGASGISPASLVWVAALAFAFAVCSGAASMILKGLSRRADDEAGQARQSGARQSGDRL